MGNVYSMPLNEKRKSHSKICEPKREDLQLQKVCSVFFLMVKLYRAVLFFVPFCIFCSSVNIYYRIHVCHSSQVVLEGISSHITSKFSVSL